MQHCNLPWFAKSPITIASGSAASESTLARPQTLHYQCSALNGPLVAAPRKCSFPNSPLVPWGTEKAGRMEANVLLDRGLTKSHANLAMPPFGSHKSLRPISWSMERTWQGQGKCFSLPGGPSGWIGFLQCPSLPDDYSVLPSSPLWLCRLYQYEKRGKAVSPSVLVLPTF